MYHESEYAPGLPFLVEVEALDDQNEHTKASITVSPIVSAAKAQLLLMKEQVCIVHTMQLDSGR